MSAPPGPLASPLVNHVLPDAEDATLLHHAFCAQHKVVVKVGPKNWFYGQRISTHGFNTEHDVDALVRALTIELAGSATRGGLRDDGAAASTLPLIRTEG